MCGAGGVDEWGIGAWMCVGGKEWWMAVFIRPGKKKRGSSG